MFVYSNLHHMIDLTIIRTIRTLLTGEIYVKSEVKFYMERQN